LFNLNGSLVLSERITDENTIDVSVLGKGVYMFKIVTEQNEYTGKVFIK